MISEFYRRNISVLVFLWFSHLYNAILNEVTLWNIFDTEINVSGTIGTLTRRGRLSGDLRKRR